MDLSGKPCGYKSGTNCSAKSCADILTAANDADCKAYLDICYFTEANKCADTKT